MIARFISASLLAAGLCPIASSQMVLSARAGLVHYADGEVQIDGERLDPKVMNFRQLSEGQRLSTKQGRAEVWLTPRGVLRAWHESDVQLLSDDILDAKVRLIAGSTVIDSRRTGSNKERISLAFGNTLMEFAPGGLYRLDAVPGQPTRLRVYKGRAIVRLGDKSRKVTKTRALRIGGDSLEQPKRFDPDFRDNFDAWNDRRNRIVARLARAGAKRQRPLSGLDNGRRGRRGGGGGRVREASNQ